MPKLIKQSRKHGTFIIEFDVEDAGLILRRKWRLFGASKGGRYAASTRAGTRQKVDLLHRMIMQPSRGEVVDHIDGNGLNNRRSNLRVCAPAENQRNRKAIQKNNRSGFKGVCFSRKTESFRAYIWHDGKSRHLGYFGDAEDAARAYDAAAKKLYGEFAKCNFSHDKNSAGQI